jgi:hypothetical protein
MAVKRPSRRSTETVSGNGALPGGGVLPSGRREWTSPKAVTSQGAAGSRTTRAFPV